MKLDEVSGVQLNEVLLSEQRGVIIDFWGTWCQPCRTLRPHLESLADQFASAWRLVAVHVETEPDLVERFGVMSTPTLVFLKGSDEVHRVTGSVTPSSLSVAMTEYA